MLAAETRTTSDASAIGPEGNDGPTTKSLHCARRPDTDTDTDTGVRDTTTRAPLATWPTISRDYWPLSRTIDPATWHDVLEDMAALLRLGCDKLKTCITHQPASAWWNHACAVTTN